MTFRVVGSCNTNRLLLDNLSTEFVKKKNIFLGWYELLPNMKGKLRNLINL